MGRPTRLPASLALAAALALGAQSLAFAQGPARDDAPTIVVTTEVLGAVVSHVAGDAADVSVLMPSGADPHSWQPSARDAERIMAASLVVENGLGLEEGLLGVLEQARAEGIPIFTATDHVELRMTEAEHDHAEGVEHDHAQGLEHDHDVVAHACGHFEDDPLDVSADGSIPDDHTRYTIALTDGSAAVTLERVEAGEVSIFLGSDVPVALSDEAGAEIEAAEMKPVGDACDAIAKAASFDLGAGTFTLELGPTSAVDGVDLVWEEASHHHGDTADEEHHEHEGEEREHAADEEHHDGEGEHAADEEHHEHEGEHGHDHGPEDPHVWLDPVAMGSIVEALVPALADVGIDVEGRGRPSRRSSTPSTPRSRR